MIFTLFVGAFALSAVYLIYHLTKNRGYLETLGIPMDEPVGLLGSGPHDTHNHMAHDVMLDKFKKLGKTFGRYDGIQPVISTVDADIIKSVLVKNFDSFTGVINMEFDPKHTTLDVSDGQTWRDLRKNLSPTFTSGKLKGMLEPMEGVADMMVAHVDGLVAKNGGIVDIKNVFQEMATNTIARCAFGVETDAHKNPNQELIKHGKAIFAGFRSTDWITSIIGHCFQYFPGFEKLIPLWPPAFDKVYEITKDILEQRTKQNVRRNDFLDRLMEMRKSRAENPNSEYLSSLKDENILAQSVIFFIAGYETTSNTLGTTVYHLATNPQAQERLYDEISQVLESREDGRLDHDAINEMTYMDAVINEDLRIAGPVIMHFRQCSKDCEIAPGLVVKKGMRVDMPIYACHHNPEYFPEPSEFRPERFLKEDSSQDIVPYTFRPFGGGPRVCIGQRFAMVEMKMVLAKLMAKYRLIATDKTRLDFLKGDLFLATYDDMVVKLEKRIEA